jgi:hypothetical protein
MRNLATITLAAIVLPALAQVPGPAEQVPVPVAQAPDPAKESGPAGIEAATPPADRFSSLLQEKLKIGFSNMPAQEAAALSRRMVAIAAQLRSTCYFIRQVNGNLQKPKDKPEFVPLAESGATPIPNSASTCMTDSIVRKASENVR